ncbi:MAG TPA: DUF4037 domain-containing protein [Pyrinomonadaceae bacterium]|jgi:hypothetical protein
MSQHNFTPGLALSEAYYREAVRPVLAARFPALPHAAAHLGWGSEVLGFDDAISTDHYWGPRCYVFLTEPDRARLGAEIGRVLGDELPFTFRGYPTNFGGQREGDVWRMEPRNERPVQHLVHVESVENFFGWYLGGNPLGELTHADWLTFAEHKLLGVTAGAIFQDEPGELTEARRRLGYYPRDVWLCLLAAQWLKLAEEEAFVGRAGARGDELGSAVIAARQVRLVMRLCFLLERRYAPYAKWLGAAFARLECAAELSPLLRKVLSSETWRERETHLAAAYEACARRHNALGVTPPLAPEPRDYYGRPFRVLHAERFAAATHAAIADERLRAPQFEKGSTNQWVDSDNRVSNVHFARRAKVMYE